MSGGRDIIHRQSGIKCFCADHPVHLDCVGIFNRVARCCTLGFRTSFESRFIVGGILKGSNHAKIFLFIISAPGQQGGADQNHQWLHGIHRNASSRSVTTRQLQSSGSISAPPRTECPCQRWIIYRISQSHATKWQLKRESRISSCQISHRFHHRLPLAASVRAGLLAVQAGWKGRHTFHSSQGESGSSRSLQDNLSWIARSLFTHA